MTEIFRFFDSTETDVREYRADEFAEYFATMFTTGVFINANGGDSLKVVTNGQSLTLDVSLGIAFIEGYMYKIIDSPKQLTLNAPDSTQNRKDLIVIRLDKETQDIKAAVKRGVTGGAAPTVERSTNIYEIAVAEVNVIAGKSYIEQSQVTDTRLNPAVCGKAAPVDMANHKDNHKTGGPDALTPADIGAASKAELTNGLALKAPLANPVFSGVPKLGLETMIHTGNIGSYAPPPINYDGRTADLLIHVNASTGNDANDGLSTSYPKKTILAAMRALPKVSPSTRYLSVVGVFNEVVTFDKFVGGEIGIYCPNTGSQSARIKGLVFENCTVSKYHVYHLDIGDYNSSNQINAYPLWFTDCTGYGNIAFINIAARNFGVEVDNFGGFLYFDKIILTVVGSTAGSAFAFRSAGTIHIDNCSSVATFQYGITASASTVFARLAGISGQIQTSKSSGAVINVYT